MEVNNMNDADATVQRASRVLATGRAAQLAWPHWSAPMLPLLLSCDRPCSELLQPGSCLYLKFQPQSPKATSCSRGNVFEQRTFLDSWRSGGIGSRTGLDKGAADCLSSVVVDSAASASASASASQPAPFRPGTHA